MSENDNKTPLERQADFAIALEDFKMNLPNLVKFSFLKAKLLMEQFNALRDQGFTEKQALEIIKSKDITLS